MKKVKRLLTYLNPLRPLAQFYINGLNRREFRHPLFPFFNERPVEYRFVFAQIARYYPKKVLDVGTGLTALPHLIANCGCQVTAIDNIKDYWRHGLFNRHYHVINDNIVQTRLAAQEFDLITCVSTLEHIGDYDQAVASMFKLLKPGGHLLLTFPYHETSFVENVYALPDSQVKKLPSYPTHAFSRQEIDRWCHGQGKVLEQEYWQFFTGEYWTVGEKLLHPKQTTSTTPHQISCLLLEKI